LTLLAAQGIGSLIITAATFGISLAVMYAVNAFGVLRVSAEGESYGLDLHEHGIPAYPEYVISSVSAPIGIVPEEVSTLQTEPVARVSVSESAG
jgi:Amt family ammonium transporter